MQTKIPVEEMQKTKKVCSFKKIIEVLQFTCIGRSMQYFTLKICLILNIKANNCKLITDDNRYFEWNTNLIIFTIDFVEYCFDLLL